MAVLSKAFLLWASARAVSASCAYGTSLHPRAEEGATVEVKTFGYSGAIGPTAWSTLAPENAVCATGQTQSPIDMTAGQFTVTPASAINLQIANIQTAEFENLGTTIEVVVPAGSGTATIDGQAFELKQFHYHLPSEHLDNGTSNAMEMHMVFESANQQIAVVGSYLNVDVAAAAGVAAGAGARVARRHPRDVNGPVEKRQQRPCATLMEAVASALGAGPACGGTAPAAGAGGATGGQPQVIQVGPGGAQQVGGGAGQTIGAGTGATVGAQSGGSDVLNSILTQAPKIATPGTKTPIGPLDMQALVASINAGNLQQYSGSLTTPPCSEGVKWNVATTKQTISLEAYTAARDVIGFNARFPQNALGQQNVLALAGGAQAGGAIAAPAPARNATA